jgi:hypothetical protein
MKNSLNPLLARQLRRLGLDVERLDEQDKFVKLLTVVSQTYDEVDQDISTLERSLSILSKEMHELYQNQSTAYEVRLRTLFNSLD